MLNDEDRQRILHAGHRAVSNRHKGFHCSESVFLAINETLQLVDPSFVRMVTGFHGGGGTHAKDPSVPMTEVLEEMASGRETRPYEELPVVQVRHLCGALAAGIVCIGLFYGREKGTDDLTCVDELCYEWHRRFSERLEAKECGELLKIWKPRGNNNNCEPVYQAAAEMAVELILEAESLFPCCRKRHP